MLTAADPTTTECELGEARAEVARLHDAIRQIAEVCRQAAAGDLEPRIRDLGAGGELDDTRRAVNHLLDLTDAFVREAGASLTCASEGKFYRRVLVRGMLGCFRDGASTINRATHAMAEAEERLRTAKADRLALADDFEQAVKSVATHVAAASTEMRATAGSLVATADHTARQSVVVSQASAQASASVTTIASATEELSSTVAEIERQVAATSQATRGAVLEVDRASETMRGLGTASSQIGQVVSIITHVANQTRLLALNATIEAARAGAAGKGFAVVASEVKNLASQTAEATERIVQQVEAIQAATALAGQAITRVGGTIRKVDEIASTITLAVEEQRQATRDISLSIHQAAEGTREVSASIQSVTSATRETSEAASQVEEAAAELSKLSEELGGQVDRFLAEIRGG
jgi:methyl-accepting chemotaxis protein